MMAASAFIFSLQQCRIAEQDQTCCVGVHTVVSVNDPLVISRLLRLSAGAQLESAIFDDEEILTFALCSFPSNRTNGT